MKRILSLAMALLTVCFLCACGEGGSTQAPSTPSGTEQATEQVDEGGNRSIEFAEPILLADDETVKIEAINFFEITQEYPGSTFTGRGITIKIQNKTNHEVNIFLENAYIGTDSVEAAMWGGSTNIMAGKNLTMQYLFLKDINAMTPIDTMEKLYQLDGKFNVLEHEINNNYDLAFSLPDALNGGNAGLGSAAGGS